MMLLTYTTRDNLIVKLRKLLKLTLMRNLYTQISHLELVQPLYTINPNIALVNIYYQMRKLYSQIPPLELFKSQYTKNQKMILPINSYLVKYGSLACAELINLF